MNMYVDKKQINKKVLNELLNRSLQGPLEDSISGIINGAVCVEEKKGGDLSSINIKWIKKDKTILFTINIDYNVEKKTVQVQCSMNMQAVTSVDEIIIALTLYKGVTDRTIEINGHKLFGDIIQGTELVAKEKDEDVTDTLKYWETVKQVENILNVHFDISYPISEHDGNMLSILATSFVRKQPCKVGRFDNVVVNARKEALQQLKQKKCTLGNLKSVVAIEKDEVCGVSLRGYYKILFYGPINIIGHKDDENLQNGLIRTKLIIKENEKTVAAEMYFKNKEQAIKYAHDKKNEKMFLEAKYPWEYR